jgi:hypothetical protein
MTDPRDPTRLRDLDPLLRQAFDVARNEQPSTATVESMIRAVEQAALGPGAHGEPLSTAASKLALLKSQAVKLLVIAGVSSGLLWTLPSLQSPATHQTSRPSPAPGLPVGPVPSSPPSTPEQLPGDHLGRSREPLEPPSASVRGSRARSTSDAKRERARKLPRSTPPIVKPPAQSAVSPAGGPDVRRGIQETDRRTRASEQGAAERRQSTDELALLEEAQRALRNSPERALELTAQHEREYPDGAYLQEREQIAIEALFNAGHSVAMRARAARFRRTFPGSAHNARITELLELQP